MVLQSQTLESCFRKKYLFYSNHRSTVLLTLYDVIFITNVVLGCS